MNRHTTVLRTPARVMLGAGILGMCGTLAAATGSWSTSGPFGGRIYDLISYQGGSGTLWVAAGGALFRTTSNGATWQRLNGGLPNTYVYVMAAASTAPVLYAASGSQLFRSGNGGDVWVPISTPAGAGLIFDIEVRPGTSNNVAILTDVGAWTTPDAGSTWTGGPLPTVGGYTPFNQIEYAGNGSLYATLNSDPSIFGGNAIIKSTDGAASWTPLVLPFGSGAYAGAIATSTLDPQRIFVAANNDLLTSPDGGLTWGTVAQPAPGCQRIPAITASPHLANGVYIACERLGLAFAPDVTGPAWSISNAGNNLTLGGGITASVNAIAVAPDSPALPKVFAGTPDGGVFRSLDAGSSWSEANNGIQATLIRALAAHPKDEGADASILAGYGDAFTPSHPVYRSPDGGATWTTSHTGMSAEQIRGLTIDPTTVDTDIFTDEPFTVYATGRSMLPFSSQPEDGGIYKSTDGGLTWTTIDTGIATVFGAPYMGTVRSLVIDPRSCSAPPPSGPCPIGGGPLQTLYAFGSGVPEYSGPGLPNRSARIYKSTNAGASWSASETGLPLPEDIDPGVGFTPVSTIAITAVIDPVTPQTLFVGTTIGGYDTSPGLNPPTLANGVFKSIDGGATWVHSSNGLPTYAGPGTSNQDVLALAMNPANTQVLYAGVTAFLPTGTVGSIYKSIDGGNNWFESSTGIAGQDVRALIIDPQDSSGNTIYAGTGGDAAGPGGVYRSTDAGATWNSYSIGLPAYSATALAMPARAPGAPARILAGTNAGVWDFTEVPDGDADGAANVVENSVLGGDANNDGTPDSQQASVASLNGLLRSPSEAGEPAGTSVSFTIEIDPASSCTQLNDSYGQSAALFPPDPLDTSGAPNPLGLVHFALPACSGANVLVTYHGANFDANWTWRNYGPRTPGDIGSFGWYTFAGATRVDADTWRLGIDALRQGNYRLDGNNILFVGGPLQASDRIYDNGFD